MAAMNAFLADVKHSIRMYFKNPGFTITAVAALAIGIGATTAIFSIVNVLLLKPLGIPDPDSLVVLSTRSKSETGDGDASSPAKFEHWKAQTTVLQDVSAGLASVMNYTGGEMPEQWQSMKASADAFRCLGIPIILGRTFTPDEDLLNGPLVAVISQALWKRRFGGDPRILGKTISLNGESHHVIGIVADSAALRLNGLPPEVYVPFQIDPNTTDQGDYFAVMARLRAGVTLEQAKARLQASTGGYRIKYPNALGPNDSFTVKTFREDMVGDVRPSLLILMGAVSLVLLIACSNVANLLLVRSASRRREIAVRGAIGAGRARVVRQLLTESVLLSIVGGALGVLLGFGGVRALLAVNTGGLVMVGKNGAAVTIDWRVMWFALVVSLLTAVVFGLFPALEVSRVDLNAVLKDSSGRSGTGLRQNKARAALVMSETGLAVVLLVGAALLMRSFVALSAVDPGFDTKNVITMNVLMTGPKYSKSARIASAVRGGLERLRSLPGVVAASATCCLPLAQGTYDLNFDIVGRPSVARSAAQTVGWVTVSPGYFEVFHIPVTRGRAFTDRDDNRTPAVVVINERMAHHYWKDRDPLGDTIVIGRGGGLDGFKDEPVRQIIGIVGDIRSEGLDTKPRPVMYVPQAQLPDAESVFFFRLMPMAWLVRTQASHRVPVRRVEEQLREATGLAVTDVAPMDQVVWAQTGRQRFNLTLMTIFGSSALLLAAIGIYGLIAYTVAQRRQEIGIRLALGAESRQVRNMVVRQGMGVAFAGIVLGIGAAWVLARSIESLLYGVQARDPVVFLTIPAVLIAVALLAVWLPATRASRLSPVEALRYE
jgi:predicted permease